jgi:hypothetical protein
MICGIVRPRASPASVSAYALIEAKLKVPLKFWSDLTSSCVPRMRAPNLIVCTPLVVVV